MPAAFQPRPVSLAVIEVRIVGLDGLQQHAAARSERRDQVDVAAGVAVLDQALAEPHELLDAEMGPEDLLDRRPVERGIAVRVQEALLGGEQRAPAVGEDRATLEHDRNRHQLVPELLGNQRAHRGITIPRRELPTPGVEPEVERDAPPVLTVGVDRAAVAQPRVVERQLDHLDAGCARAPRLVGLFAGIGDHRHRLEVGDRVRDRGVVGTRLLERLPPQLDSTRPAHQRSLMRLPFGGSPHGNEPNGISLNRGTWSRRNSAPGRTVEGIADPLKETAVAPNLLT